MVRKLKIIIGKLSDSVGWYSVVFVQCGRTSEVWGGLLFKLFKNFTDKNSFDKSCIQNNT